MVTVAFRTRMMIIGDIINTEKVLDKIKRKKIMGEGCEGYEQLSKRKDFIAMIPAHYDKYCPFYYVMIS